MRKTVNGRQVSINVVGGSTFGRYAKISSAKTYNMFMTKDGLPEGDYWLVNTPGYQRIYDVQPTGQGRGRFVSTRGNFLITVVNSTVYRFDSNFNPTFIGNLTTEIGEVFIDENLASQICIVDGVNAYIYNYSLPPNLTIQSGLGTLIPNYVQYQNTFFLFGNADTTSSGSKWYAYKRDTDTTIVVETELAIQTKPDFSKAVVSVPEQGNNVLVLGNVSGEIWNNVGGLQNYRKNTTINIDYGTPSVSTIAKSDKFIMWLGTNQTNSPGIMMYSNQGSMKVSTAGIDYILSKMKFPEQSTAMFYRQDGHLFYQLTFYNPVDNLTLLYDCNTQVFFNLSDFNLNYHPARDYIYFNLKTYFISLNNGSIYESSTDYTTYNENLPVIAQNPNLNHEIPRIRITDTVQEKDSSQFRANSFVFTLEQGNDPRVTDISLENNEDLLISEDSSIPADNVIYTEFGTAIAAEDSGYGVGLGSLPIPYRPRVDLSISRDGGIIFGNTVGKELNTIGHPQNIINWENMGACNSWTAKLRFWGTSRVVANDGILEIF